jgi:hypothetical protein
MSLRKLLISGAFGALSAGFALPVAAQESGGEGATDVQSFVAAWAASAHADATAEAFTHWNEEGEVPPACAICHAGAGFRDFYGIDGSAPGVVDAPAKVGGVIDCDTCHKEGVDQITEIRFPSGVSVAPLENSATCMTCHQGRQSGPGVAASVEGMEEDTVNPEIRFLNPHYAAAAATVLGSEVSGYYEYPGRSYVGRFEHVPAAQECATCHEPHSLEVVEAECKTCHAAAETPKDIRVNRVDFDGDGTGLTGISKEVENMTAMLGDLVIDYAAEVAGAPVLYVPESYPYFFNDTNGNGTVDEGEVSRDNAFASWTPRMLKGAYNYQFVKKDPGSYAHNPRYVLQVLHDSIADLSGAMGREPPMIARAE